MYIILTVIFYKTLPDFTCTAHTYSENIVTMCFHVHHFSVQSAAVEPAKTPRAIGQLGDHHWAAIFVLGFALAAILVAFLLEKFVHVSS